MLHYSCDICKRPSHPDADVRHVVKIEIFPAVEDEPCSCSEIDEFDEQDDHLEEVQELLEQLGECDDPRIAAEAAARSLRFDLCDACRQRFVKNPLGLKSGKQLDFSNN
jgi:hypothetical protein